MIRNIRRNQRVITEITEFSGSPYCDYAKLICVGIDYYTRGERLAGVVCAMVTSECWIRWANGETSKNYKNLNELISSNPNTKFYQL
jgi:hypothetical protein